MASSKASFFSITSPSNGSSPTNSLDGAQQTSYYCSFYINCSLSSCSPNVSARKNCDGANVPKYLHQAVFPCNQTIDLSLLVYKFNTLLNVYKDSNLIYCAFLSVYRCFKVKGISSMSYSLEAFLTTSFNKSCSLAVPVKVSRMFDASSRCWPMLSGFLNLGSCYVDRLDFWQNP